PPYLPFSWMGNLDGWGGPLSENWIQEHEELQKRILKRERELGMNPVLQGFTGHIPAKFAETYNDSVVSPLHWQEWETVMLEPSSPEFNEMAKIYMEEQTKLFGVSQYYASDSYNEMLPASGDEEYLKKASQSILKGITFSNPNAKWILQGWTFDYKKEFWSQNRIKAFLEDIPNKNILILDLFCEKNEVWRQTDAFYGKPWLWCNIQSFGGNTDLHGSLNTINTKFESVLTSDSKGELSGIGFVNEAFEGNPIVYEYLTELPWHSDPVNVNEWTQTYVKSRYGLDNYHAQKAWELLLESVYNDSVDYKTFMSAVQSPRLYFKKGFPFDYKILVEAYQELILAGDSLKSVETYTYDLTSVGMQVLACESQIQHEKLINAYHSEEIDKLRMESEKMLEIINDMDKLAASHPKFLLGNWLEDAKRWGRTNDESELYEWNARRFITLWGTTGSLRDYSNRMWAGMLSNFYQPRWKMFTDSLVFSLKNQLPFNYKKVNQSIIDWELDWANSKKEFSTLPTGDFYGISDYLWKKYNFEKYLWPDIEGITDKIFIGKTHVVLKGLPDSEIRYTIDGSVPGKNSKLFKKHIVLRETTLLRIKEYDINGNESPEYQAQYTKVDPIPNTKIKGAEPGLEYQYFELSEEIFSVREMETLEPIKSGKINDIVFPHEEEALPEKFALIYEGYIKISKTDIYSFLLISNDGSRLFIDDNLIVNNDGQHGALTVEGAVALKKGYHKLRLLYFQTGGGKALNLRWKRSGIKEEKVPKKVLFHNNLLK
ncbi:MAG: alpha-N-acetylglucosaminidase TIM-barrel domain-containing protein, partial [Bacteroidota bacterium]